METGIPKIRQKEFEYILDYAGHDKKLWKDLRKGNHVLVFRARVTKPLDVLSSTLGTVNCKEQVYRERSTRREKASWPF
jgi:hypothetical protein